ncbi:MAG: four helix bundle protein [Bacteroidota bacterium]
MPLVRFHYQLEVYRDAFDLAIILYGHTKAWPATEQYALSSQIVRSSRSICSNIAEIWGRRDYTKSFRAKIVDALSEAYETITWLEFAEALALLSAQERASYTHRYHGVAARLHNMRENASSWCFDGNR